MSWGKGTTNNSIGWGKGADNNGIGWGSAYPVSNSGDTDIQSGLSNTVAPVISGTNEVGETLSCTSGTWSGGTPITYAYQWKRDGVSIGSATNSTYLLISADAETDITCTVTATNAEGSNSATSNTITIAADVDSDAQAFITAASITDPTQQGAVNQLVLDLKAASIWTKMKAVYPFIGSSASSHKWNLKDPRDLDAAFRLSFAGGWTHSATGSKPNGTTGYASTFLSLQSALSSYSTSHHLAFYSRTQNPTGDGWVMGVGDTNTGDPLYGLALRRAGTNALIYDFGNFSGNGRLSGTETDARGFYVGSTNANNSHKLYKNGTSVLTSTNIPTQTAYNFSLWIGAMNGVATPHYYQDNECAFASIGDGLSDAEVTALNNAVQTFQTTLSRNV